MIELTIELKNFKTVKMIFGGTGKKFRIENVETGKEKRKKKP